MTAIPVMPFRWDGEAMIPLYRQHADRHYVIGEVYGLEPREDRSPNSHAHYFASVADAWSNLPESYRGRWLTPDELRAHALIHTGYANPPQHFVCATHAEAQRLCKHLAQVEPDIYAEIVLDGTTVTRLTSKSQSYRAMKRREFQDSKTKVLDYLSAMIGVEPRTLEQNAGRAA